MALISDSSMNRLATMGLMGEPLAVPSYLFKIFILEEEMCFKTELQQCSDMLYGH